MFHIKQQFSPGILSVAFMALAAAAFSFVAPGLDADIIRKAANIETSAEGLQGFVATCNALVTPALVAAAAATPLAVIGGGVALAFGSRRGLPIIITALGVLAVLGSVKGIVA